MGDAGEMLVAAELTLAGVPALKMPDNWPGYDVIAQPVGPPDRPPQRISVKTRTFASGNFVGYSDSEIFDWLAIVILGPGTGNRRIFIVPRKVADERSYKADRYWLPAKSRAGNGFFVNKLVKQPTAEEPQGLADFENNFDLTRGVGP